MFELKSDLPDGFYDALWARVNPPSLDINPVAGGHPAASARR